MKTRPGLNRDPVWKELLHLGEGLLEYQTASSQIEFVRQSLEERFNASSDIWFAQPFYPLPGESQLNLVPSTTAPELISESFIQRQILIEVNGGVQSRSSKIDPVRIAFPLLTQQDLLGILLVERDSGFSKTEQDFLEALSANWAVAMQVTRQVVIKNWRFDQLALVRNVSKQIANQRDLDALYQQVVDLVQETFNIYFVSIFTVNNSDDALNFQASAGSAECSCAEIKFDVHLGEGIIGTVAKTGEELSVTVVTDELLFRTIDALPETLSEVAVPIKSGDQILGVLDLQSNQRQSFHEYDLMIIRALADNIGTAIEGARLLGGMEKRASQISAVLDISHALTSILEFEELMEEVVHSIQKRFGYPFVHIYLTHPGRNTIYYEAGSGARSQSFLEHKVAYDIDDPQGIIPHVARTGETLLANDISLEPLFRPSDILPADTRAELAIPLAFAGHILGVLDLQSDQLNGFDLEDIPLLEALSASIAIAVRNATLYRSETWRHKVTDSFRDIAGLVSANIALDELLDRILTELEKNLPCEVSAIWLIDESSSSFQESMNLKLAAVHGAPSDKVNDAVGIEIAREFLEMSLIATDPTIRTASDPVGPLGQAMGYEKDYSSVAVPLRAGDRVLGVLAIAHPTAGRYGSEAGLVTMTLANNAAVAIQNNQLFASAQEQAWVSTILLQIAEATQADLTVDDLLATLTRLTPLLIGVKKCAFFLWDKNNQKFNLKSHYGIDFVRDPQTEFDKDLPAFAQLVDSCNAVFIQNPQDELGIPGAALAENHGTLVLLPLLSRGNLLGAYLVGHQVEGELFTNNAFDQQILSLLQGIAQQTAVALENLQLLDASQEEAYVTAVLLQVAQAVVSQNDLEDILETIVHLMPILVGIDACAIYLWRPQEQAFQLSKAFLGSTKEEAEIDGQLYTPADFPLLREVLEQDAMLACRLDEPDLSIQRWRELNCFTPAQDFNWSESNSTSWVLGVPLSLKGEAYGVLVALESKVPLAFHERRLEILTGVAQQVSLAIQNERLNIEMVQRERLEREIQLARQIQRTFLPSHLPEVDGWEIDIQWQTAREVGGDFYDVFRLDKNRLGLVIADVSDKGMPAALYMTVARTLIRAFVHNISSPARILDRVNRLLVVDSQDGLFVTAIYAILDTKTGTLTYTNAGHNRPLILRGESHKIESLPKGGMALGIMANSRLENYTIEIVRGDALLMYTDGVTESFSPAGEIFGEKRLLSALRAAPDNRPITLKEHLSKVLSSFREDAPLSDDLTLVFLRRLNNGN